MRAIAVAPRFETSTTADPPVRCMTITLAPSPWSAPRGRHGPAAWRFGQETSVERDGVATPAMAWRFVRGRSFAPRQMAVVCAVLCAVSLAFGLIFWQLGAPGVLPFAGAEGLLVLLTFGMAARHARDAETITLAAHELQVEHRCGRRLERADFRAEWVRIEPAHGETSLVELSGQGRRMRVGRYLRPELRPALAQELRAALKREHARPPWQASQSGNRR